MFKIGNIEIKNQVVVAPMAGVSNVAFRTLMKEFGAGLIYSEMVSNNALVYANEKTFKMLKIVDEERPLVMQIFGSDTEMMVNGAKIIEKQSDCDIIDINVGCPVKKIVKNGAGSKLMTTPEKLYNIVNNVVSNVSVPVTVKIRSGWNQDNINAVEIAKIVEKAGAKAIAVHGRTRSQLYRGEADWRIIKDVKDAVDIPVIGNGDIKTPEDAKKMLDETGCDAIMIGRGLLGNPFVIRQTVEFLSTGEYTKDYSKYDKLDMLIEHAKRLVKVKGEHLALLEMRGQAPYYVKGLHGAKTIKIKLAQISKLDELITIIENYKDYLKERDTLE
ncbi:MAG: tRNA dihydrouridine synthase DusB [Candidatus Izimaplasma sp.]|nr:tRNA dihydrouridine synthase DusB [Candidatus Izimaplasma bacterium]